MNRLKKIGLTVLAILMLFFIIATAGACGMTIFQACTYEPSVSIAQYEPESMPDIYDV